LTEHLLQAIHIRRLAPGDSLDELTSMLHRAFSNLGRMGLNCTCVNQSIETTAQRVRLGECYVAVCDGRLVGTATLHKPDRHSECHWYRRTEVASVHQFAVDPSFQGTGCGKALLLVAARWAREHHYRELALNTPAPASRLIQFYASQGFRAVEQVQLPGKAYRSSVLSKTLDAAPAARAPWHFAPPPRRTVNWGVMASR
jgi:GNAT superfamily N-acetyltransferase